METWLLLLALITITFPTATSSWLEGHVDNVQDMALALREDAIMHALSGPFSTE